MEAFWRLGDEMRIVKVVVGFRRNGGFGVLFSFYVTRSDEKSNSVAFRISWIRLFIHTLLYYIYFQNLFLFLRFHPSLIITHWDKSEYINFDILILCNFITDNLILI